MNLSQAFRPPRFSLRVRYIVAEKANQKSHNKRVKKTSEVFGMVLHDYPNTHNQPT
jgi:hypothetical protein